MKFKNYNKIYFGQFVMKIVFGFWGFLKNTNSSYSFDIKSDKYDKYIFSPEFMDENCEKRLDKNMLSKKYGEKSKITLYEYEKQIHIDKCSKVWDKKFVNGWYQQGYRIFSFFYSVKGLCTLIKNNNYDPETIIFISRIDVGLHSDDEKLQNIVNKLVDNDILISGIRGKGIDDKYFITKFKHLDVFINLYDDYALYLSRAKNGEPGKPPSTRPEDVFKYHFDKNNLKMEQAGIQYSFRHICSKYCGHNREKTVS